MPTPTDLRSVLNGLSAWDPSRAREEYSGHRDLWQLYLDLLELDRQKLEGLIEKHHDAEGEAKVKLRKALAIVFNLIPSVLDVVKLYLFAEEPTFDVGGDGALEAFIADCDGCGTPWAQYVRQTALPLALCQGWIDVLVANPRVDGGVISAADAAEASLQMRHSRCLLYGEIAGVLRARPGAATRRASGKSTTRRSRSMHSPTSSLG